MATDASNIDGAKDFVFHGDGTRVAIDNNSGSSVAMNFNAFGDTINSGRLVFNDKIVTNGSSVLNINAPSGVSIVPVGAPTTGTILFNADMTGIKSIVNFYNGTIAVVGSGGTLFSNEARTNIMAGGTQTLDLSTADALKVYNQIGRAHV